MPLVHIDVYVPFLPCACQPGKVDRKATAFNEVLLELKDRFKGELVFSVYALNLHFQRFKETPAVAATLQTQGQKGLPVICVNGAPLFVAAYPDGAELEGALRPLLTPSPPAP